MNSDTILVIGSFDCNDHTNTILESVKLSVGQPQWSELGGPDVDIASQVGIDDSALVESVFGVRISGSDGDDLEARLNSLRAELATTPAPRTSSATSAP